MSWAYIGAMCADCQDERAALPGDPCEMDWADWMGIPPFFFFFPGVTTGGQCETSQVARFLFSTPYRPNTGNAYWQMVFRQTGRHEACFH